MVQSTQSDRHPIVGRIDVAVLIALVSITVLSVYLSIFYPGLVSWDFYVQWFQATGRIPYSDWHPLFYTLLVTAVSFGGISPVLVSAAQILTFSLLLVMTLKRLERYGVPFWPIIFLACFQIVHPLNGMYMVSLWKDIAYALSLWWYTLLVIDIACTGGEILKRNRFFLALLLAVLFVSLIRHNGIVPAFGTGIVLFILFRQARLHILGVYTLSLLLIVLFKTVFFQMLAVDVAEKNVLKAHLPVQHIGFLLNENGRFSGSEREYLATLANLETWRRKFDVSSCMPLIFGRDQEGIHYLNGDKLKNDEEYLKFRRVWSGLVLRNPLLIIRYHLQASEGLWKINSDKWVFVIPDEDLNAEHLLTGYQPGSPRLYQRVSVMGKRMVKLIQNRDYGWLVHRAPVYFWGLLLSVAVALVYRSKRVVYFPATLPLLLQSVTLIAFPLVQDTRFFYPIILITPCLLVFLFADNPKLRGQNL